MSPDLTIAVDGTTLDVTWGGITQEDPEARGYGMYNMPGFGLPMTWPQIIQPCGNLFSLVDTLHSIYHYSRLSQTKLADYVMKFDIRTIVVALALNSGLITYDDLTILTRSDDGKSAHLIHPNFPGMGTVLCFTTLTFKDGSTLRACGFADKINYKVYMPIITQVSTDGLK